MSRPLRLVVRLAGGAALGAYEAGAAAGLLLAVRQLRASGQDVRIDVLGGASAGGLVAFLAAVTAQTGRDPVEMLHRAWVQDVDAEVLRDDASLAQRLAGERTGPLSFAALPDGFAAIWEDLPRGEPLQDEAMVLQVVLTDLAGDTEALDGLRGDDTVTAPTYVRDVAHVVPAGVGDHDLDVLHDAVFASAANPGAFAPRLVDGRWSVDGAMLGSRPLRRALASRQLLASGASSLSTDVVPEGPLADELELPDGTTLVLVVDPRSEDPSGASRWRDADHPPTWLSGLARALAILGTQALYDDVRDLLVSEDDRLLVDVLDPAVLADDAGVPELLAGEFLGDFGGFLDRDLRHSDFVLGYATTLRWAEQALPRLGVPDDVVDDVTDALREAHEHDWRAVNEGDARAAALDRAARWGLAKLAAEAVAAAGRSALSGPFGAAGDLLDTTRDRLSRLLP